MYTVKQMSIELTFDLQTKSIQYYLYICHSQFRAFSQIILKKLECDYNKDFKIIICYDLDIWRSLHCR